MSCVVVFLTLEILVQLPHCAAVCLCACVLPLGASLTRVMPRCSPYCSARAHGDMGFNRADAEALLRLMCIEVATVSGDTPWCSVLSLTVDGDTMDHFRVLREFDKAAVKAHLEGLMRTLEC